MMADKGWEGRRETGEVRMMCPTAMVDIRLGWADGWVGEGGKSW